MSIFTRRRPEVKSWPTRHTPRPEGHPFGQGIYRPVPAEPTVDAMPRRVRWEALDLTPLEDLVEPDAEMCPSGAWRVPGEDWSWELGHDA